MSSIKRRYCDFCRKEMLHEFDRFEVNKIEEARYLPSIDLCKECFSNITGARSVLILLQAYDNPL